MSSGAGINSLGKPPPFCLLQVYCTTPELELMRLPKYGPRALDDEPIRDTNPMARDWFKPGRPIQLAITYTCLSAFVLYV
jgi:hypothetical protein